MEEFMHYVPQHWELPGPDSVRIYPKSREFWEIKKDFTKHGFLLIRLWRQQLYHQYSLFFVREKFLTTVYPMFQYYRVRKYVKVPKELLKMAIKTNLDKRRCGYDFVMKSSIDTNLFGNKFFIFIVCVITWDIESDVIVARKSSDYYIEYICRVKRFGEFL